MKLMALIVSLGVFAASGHSMAAMEPYSVIKSQKVETERSDKVVYERMGACETLAFAEYHKWSLGSNKKVISGSIKTGAGLIILGAFKHPISIIPAGVLIGFGVKDFINVSDRDERFFELKDVLKLYSEARTGEGDYELSEEVADYINQLNDGEGCRNAVVLGYTDIAQMVDQYLSSQ